jgi:general secretion pathway protein K
MKRDERGFALIAVLLVLALLGIVGAEFAYSMRLEASAMRSWRDNLAAAHLAEAGVEQAIRELYADFKFVSLAEDGQLTFYTQDRLPLARLPRTRVRLGAGEFSYVISDEQSRINVNRAAPERLDRLLQCLGVDKIVRDQIVDSIQDWKDPNDDHRMNGAESEDYYLKLPTPYRARNGDLESIHELLQIKAVTRAIFDGSGDRPGLVDVLTTRSPTPDNLNVNTVSPLVLCGVGVAEAQVSLVTQQRRLTPYFVPPGNLAPPGTSFGVTSQIFRIEADGLIEGRPRASVTALVVKPADPAAAITIVEWSGIR